MGRKIFLRKIKSRGNLLLDAGFPKLTFTRESLLGPPYGYKYKGLVPSVGHGWIMKSFISSPSEEREEREEGDRREGELLKPWFKGLKYKSIYRRKKEDEKSREDEEDEQ